MPSAEACPECGSPVNDRLSPSCPFCGRRLHPPSAKEAIHERAGWFLRFISWVRRINAIWAALAFLVAVIQAMLIMPDVNIRVLALFIVPPAMALIVVLNPASSGMARFLALSLLFIVELSVVLAEIPSFYPDAPRDPAMPPVPGRILSFYLIGWLFFIFALLPPCVFAHSIYLHRHGLHSELSKPVAIFGLSAWGFIAVLMLLAFTLGSSSSSAPPSYPPVPTRTPAGAKASSPAAPTSASASSYPWLKGRAASPGVIQRIAPPAGFQRVPAKDGSFADWLRNLPLKPGVPKVLLFNGKLKSDQNAHVGVLDLDVGTRDLQQCADSVIRLRAEYLYSVKRTDDIAFHFTSGDLASFSKWSQGLRPVVRGNSVTWSRTGRPDSGYDSFRNYLDVVFTYAGTMSLAKELSPVRDPADLRIGDVIIDPGSPGHAVIVLDLVENAAHRKLFLLAQGYMPAQEMHVLKNPSDPALSPWYPLPLGDKLLTPEYPFSKPSPRRFPD